MEHVPRQFVYIPGVEEVDVGESQRDGSFGLGEGRDVEIRAQRYGGSNCRLENVMRLACEQALSRRRATYLAVDD